MYSTPKIYQNSRKLAKLAKTRENSRKLAKTRENSRKLAKTRAQKIQHETDAQHPALQRPVQRNISYKIKLNGYPKHPKRKD